MIKKKNNKKILRVRTPRIFLTSINKKIIFKTNAETRYEKSFAVSHPSRTDWTFFSFFLQRDFFFILIKIIETVFLPTEYRKQSVGQVKTSCEL